MSVRHVFLMIGVNPFLFSICSLLGLSHLVILSNTSQVPLVISISENLLSSLMLKLQSVQFILWLFLFVGLVLLTNLLGSLKHDLLLLSFCESLEVIWLYSMISQHRNLSLLVLSHEIMVICVVELMGLRLLPLLMLKNLAVLLLLS